MASSAGPGNNGPQRGSAEVERPISIHSHDSHDSTSDKTKEKEVDDHVGEDLIHAATVGEPCGTPYGEPSLPPSRVSSHHSRPPVVIVPRAKRRGLLAGLAIIPEVERPYDYKRSTKWTITLTIALATTAAPLGSTIFYPALPTLSAELGATDTVANLSVAMYMLSMSIFPLWWSAFSERYGRRSIYLISFFLFLVFSIASALSTNIAMLVVFRICAGGSSASVQAVGAGTVADVWETFERGRAMGIFYLGPLLGPLIGPIVGGVLADSLGWQSNMWFCAIYALITWFLILLLLPETLVRQRVEEPIVNNLQRTTTLGSAKAHTKRVAGSLRRFFIDPMAVLLYLRFPPIQITVFLGAIAFAGLFIANVSIQQLFQEAPYNFNTTILGLLYIAPGLGYIITSVFGGRWIDRIMAHEAKKANRYDENGRLIYLPEDRMRENMWLANSVYPLSLLVYGWTVQYGVQFMVPLISLFLFGASSMLVFSAATTMLTEFVRKKSSAGVAINNFVRNIFSCLGVVVAAPWVHAIGAGWVFTTICIFSLIFGFAGIFLLRRNAQKWRVEMDKALNDMK
ncbi:hypothetical protein S7711_04616 [Stachybotrys chartarum IBT 7711]|uniref:Major facilitator superfamily (MFS) profile domain-containing protein n=1 Tax=Stachybotrys chartarum (strain CBS 109288 / IBT 7711) TaxID=1280523 RepID=A0A084AUH2_STACB|nr:hypothetical protein S7711_04616 [Stachybotrys chartarum IBT 7711]KFA52047.1 hypothetical protein S40293_02984 [Stachybotrys chartarum IBT 40293]